MKLFRVQFLIALLCCLSMAGIGLGQATKPAAQSAQPAQSAAPLSPQAKADQAIEDESLQATDTTAKPATPKSTGTTADATSSTSELMRVLFALAIVVGIILLLRTGVRKMALLPGAGKAGKLVTVVSRSMISPRQQILVLQVGKRLLVVGDSGGAMSVLSEMSDPDEIASLIGQSRQTDHAQTDRRTFGNLFRRATEPFDGEHAGANDQGANNQGADEHHEYETADEAERSEPSVEPVSVEDVGGLLDKVRLLQEQFKVRSEGKSA